MQLHLNPTDRYSESWVCFQTQCKSSPRISGTLKLICSMKWHQMSPSVVQPSGYSWAGMKGRREGLGAADDGEQTAPCEQAHIVLLWEPWMRCKKTREDCATVKHQHSSGGFASESMASFIPLLAVQPATLSLRPSTYRCLKKTWPLS